ncbi:ribosome hibernation-promoting factor, HPF/YfiA family, partial [Acidaminococcus intestini]
MTVRVRGKNLEVTPALKDYVEKKVETITKQFKTVGEITAVMRIERNKHIVE